MSPDTNLIKEIRYIRFHKSCNIYEVYVHLLGRLVCLQASPYYLLRSAGVVWVVPAITYVSYNGAVIICQVSQPWDIRSDRDFYVRLHLRSESNV